MAKPEKLEKNISSEEKIKEAARIVFTKKGYAATKTRDIAEQAGINLALLNYYFRSKEKLFEIIMTEKIKQLFGFLAPILNDKTTTLDDKIDLASVKYIEMLLLNPDLPFFVLGEIRANPERFRETVNIESILLKSHFFQQLAEKKPKINPFQFLISFLGMLVFPFAIQPVFESAGVITKETFNSLMEERKILISNWMKTILE